MTKTTRRVLLVAALAIAAIAVSLFFVMRERTPTPPALAGRR